MSTAATLTLILIFINASVFAAPGKFDLSVGLSYENSDNILLAPINKRNENILHTLLDAEYQRESATFTTNFSLNVNGENYQNHTLSDYVAVSSQLKLTSTVSRKRLYWDALNRFDRVQTSQAIVNTPLNQQNVNYFSTGPRFIFFENQKSSLYSDVKYENFYTETSVSDYHGAIANAVYTRNISHTTSLGLTTTYNNRKFDNSVLNTDYKKTDILVNFRKRMKLSELQVDVGRTMLKFHNAHSEEYGLFRARYQYRLGEKTRLDASYRRESSDYSSLFSSGIAGAPTYTNVSGATYIVKEGRLNVTRSFGSSRIGYAYDNVNNDYSSDISDLNTSKSTLTFFNSLTPSLHMNISGTYRDTKFLGLKRVDIANIYKFEISEEFQNRYNLKFNIQYTDNRSTDTTFIYNERRVSVAGHYSFR